MRCIHCRGSESLPANQAEIVLYSTRTIVSITSPAATQSLTLRLVFGDRFLHAQEEAVGWLVPASVPMRLTSGAWVVNDLTARCANGDDSRLAMVYIFDGW